MIEIQTERLRLIPLTRDQLLGCLENLAEVEQHLGMTVSRRVLSERVCQAMKLKIEQMDCVDKRHHPWCTYWLIVIAETQWGAGLAGFRGIPDENGQVEIWYGMDPQYQGKGYTTEAVRTLIAWAFEEPSCRSVLARETLKSAPASYRVPEKAGMTIIEENEDYYSWQIVKDPG